MFFMKMDSVNPNSELVPITLMAQETVSPMQQMTRKSKRLSYGKNMTPIESVTQPLQIYAKVEEGQRLEPPRSAFTPVQSLPISAPRNIYLSIEDLDKKTPEEKRKEKARRKIDSTIKKTLDDGERKRRSNVAGGGSSDDEVSEASTA